MSEHARPEPQGNMHQANQDRYFYAGAGGSGQGRTELIQKTAMKTGSYHSRVYLRNSRNRVSIPPKKGIPKWMKIRSVALTRLAHEADFRFAGLGGTVSDIMPVGIQYGGIAKPA